jgi:glycosyltransferase involved in cell wall biosynthesis
MLNRKAKLVSNITPMISVIMPVYNAGEYVKEAIESILNQTYSDWELIIIDDCSTDNSVEIIQSFHDKRIVLLKNEINSGIAKTSNKGLKIAQGKYITRMDSDDIAFPLRFEKQVKFLEENPDYVLCACDVQMFGARREFFTLPEKDQQLKVSLLYQNPFVNSSVLIRGKDFKKYLYNELFSTAEDYELWINLKEEGKFASIPEVLFQYRVHSDSISFTSKHTMSQIHRDLLIKQLNQLNIQPSSEELFVHAAFSNLKGRKDIDPNTFLPQLKKWMQKLLEANAIQSIYDPKEMELMLAFRWILAAYFLNKPCRAVFFFLKKNIFSFPYRKLCKLLLRKYKIKKEEESNEKN